MEDKKEEEVEHIEQNQKPKKYVVKKKSNHLKSELKALQNLFINYFQWHYFFLAYLFTCHEGFYFSKIELIKSF